MLSLFFVDELSGSKTQILDSDEAHHAIKVMRLKIGEEIKISDGEGSWVSGPISEIDKIMSEAIIVEDNSNQILDFTREVKNVPDSDKIKIIESLWKIIYSNDSADIYETNLMRRLSGLLYVDAKTMGDLKLKVKSELGK